jgi:Zn-dependent protease/CBS domain-containing protein
MSSQNEDNRHTSQHVTPGRAWTLSLGTVAGIPLRLHFTFFLLIIWLALGSGQTDHYRGLLYVLGLFTCVMLHELGHSLVAQRYGIQVSEIVMYPIGGVARMEKMPAPKEEFWVALAGPAVNFLITAIILASLKVSGNLVPLKNLLLENGNWWEKLAIANVALALFNLIPAFPMDGGRVLRSLLAMRMNEVRATEIAASIGQFLAIGIGLLGLFYNPFLLFIAFFVFLGAGQEAAMYRGKALTEGLKVQAAMVTEFKTLPAGSSLGEAADMLLKTAQQDFPVMLGEQVIGVLSRQSLLRGFAAQGGDGYVAGVMDREFVITSPEDDLQTAVEKMQSDQRSCLLVMENERLVGLVTVENLAELMVVRRLMQKG